MKTAEELWDEYGGEPWAVFIEAIRDETRKECAGMIKPFFKGSILMSADSICALENDILNAGKRE